MRRVLLTIGVILFVAVYIYLQESSVSPPVHLASKDNTHVYQLGNGLKVIVVEDNRAPVVVSQVWYKVGSSYEPEGKTGMSHVLEHMMFKGTHKLEPGEFSEIIARNGGKENAFTSKDYTAYFQRISKDRLELCFELEADRMRNLVIDDAEFKKEVEVVKEERRLRTEDKPTSLTYEKFNAVAFGSGPYHHPVIGWMEDLNHLTAENMRQWYQKWYAPNNATLIVSGDVVASEVVTLANRYFGGLKPSANQYQAPRDSQAQNKRRSILVELPAKVPYLLMGYKVPSLKDAENKQDVYALEVLSGLLDGGNSARLTKNLVRGSQLATSASAGYNAYDRLNTLFLFSGIPSAKSSIAELQQALIDEIETIKTTPPDAMELDRVIAQVIAADVYEKDSMFYQAMQLGILETTGLGWQKKDEYLENIRRITPQQVQAVARKYFTDDRLTVGELKPLPMDNTQASVTAKQGAIHVN